jgi:hypothetical protein
MASRLILTAHRRCIGAHLNIAITKANHKDKKKLIKGGLQNAIKLLMY